MKFALLSRHRDDGGFLHLREAPTREHVLAMAQSLLAGSNDPKKGVACVEVFQLFATEPDGETYASLWRVGRSTDDVVTDITDGPPSSRPGGLSP